MSLKTEVGKRLKESRKAVQLTQTQVAGLMNMRQQYSRFETGRFELNYEQIIFLCRLFDISSDYLFGLAEI